MATLVATSGKVTEVKPANGRDFTLEELYRHVGCEQVEFVYHPDGHILVIDEEAKLNEPPKPYNPRATAVARECGIAADDWISGPALICGPGEIR